MTLNQSWKIAELQNEINLWKRATYILSCDILRAADCCGKSCSGKRCMFCPESVAFAKRVADYSGKTFSHNMMEIK